MSNVYVCPICRNDVRVQNGRFVPHDTEGLEPIGEGYWSGNNEEGIGHTQCLYRSVTRDAVVIDINGCYSPRWFDDDDPEDVAHMWASKMYSEMEYPDEMECIVLRHDGSVTRVIVEVETEPVFRARVPRG